MGVCTFLVVVVHRGLNFHVMEVEGYTPIFKRTRKRRASRDLHMMEIEPLCAQNGEFE